MIEFSPSLSKDANFNRMFDTCYRMIKHQQNLGVFRPKINFGWYSERAARTFGPVVVYRDTKGNSVKVTCVTEKKEDPYKGKCQDVVFVGELLYYMHTEHN